MATAAIAPAAPGVPKSNAVAAPTTTPSDAKASTSNAASTAPIKNNNNNNNKNNNQPANNNAGASETAAAAAAATANQPSKPQPMLPVVVVQHQPQVAAQQAAAGATRAHYPQHQQPAAPHQQHPQRPHQPQPPRPGQMQPLPPQQRQQQQQRQIMQPMQPMQPQPQQAAHFINHATAQHPAVQPPLQQRQQQQQQRTHHQNNNNVPQPQRSHHPPQQPQHQGQQQQQQHNHHHQRQQLQPQPQVPPQQPTKNQIPPGNGNNHRQHRHPRNPGHNNAPNMPAAQTSSVIPQPNGAGRSIPPAVADVPRSATSNSIDESGRTPLYDRLVSEEVRELKEYVRLVEHQSRRLVDLDAVHRDLESRLEASHARGRRLERTLGRTEAQWEKRCQALKGEKAAAERKAAEERAKVDKLMEMVNRLQTEIHTLIKNRFGHAGGNAQGLTPSPSYGGGIKRVPSGQAAGISVAASSERSNANWDKHGRQGSNHHSPPFDGSHHGHPGGSRRDYSNGSHSAASRGGRHIGPDEMLAQVGSAEAVRERNAFGSLLDFFGM